MKRLPRFTVLIALLLFAAAAQAQLVINPTTTYTAETSKNTSASSMFTDVYFITKQNATVSNGDAVPSNVSKVDIHALYPNNSTKIYAEWQAWWCHQTSNEQADGTLNPNTSQHSCSSHIDIGYSNTQSQVTAEVNDMISRGFAGAIIDWNGPGTISDTSAGYLRTAAEATGGQFQFAIMIDKGAFGSCVSSGTCTSTGITRVQDVMNRYASSSAYIKTSDSRPIIFFFVDGGTSPNNTQIDWASLRSNSGGNPLFLGDGKGNFSVMDGAYGWENVVLTGDRTGVTYLDQFYQSATSSANASKPVVGATFKGFNDTLASWSPAPPNGPRINFQRCGMTWLNTFAHTRQFYPPATKPLNWIQAVTWDDYEEGTEIETGIDNCVSSVTGGVSGSTLSWKTNFGPDPDDPTLTGTEATVHHYTVFISTDGQNLMVLADNITPGLNTLDLSQYGIGPGNYTLYVKAVGQPSIVNHMSGPIQYNVSGNTCFVTMTSPANGATVNSPVQVTASANPPTGATVTSMEIDVDGTAVFTTTTASSVDQAVTMTNGSHLVTVKATDSQGDTCSQTSSINVGPQGVTVSVTSPAAGATVTSPATVTASASSTHTITGWHIYVDNVDSFSAGAVNSISASLPLAAGTHTIITRAWDSTGAFGDDTRQVTATAGVTVTVTAPTSTSVNSPVTIAANATSPNTITGWHIYVDGADVFTGGQVSSISASLAMTTGSHTVIVRAWDSSGAFGDQTLNLTVTEPITVTVSSPANNATVNSPVAINASASSGHTVTGWHIYVDGVNSYSAGQVNSISASVPMDLGSHTVIVRAWDSTGAFADKTLTLNVVSGVNVTVSTPVPDSTVASPVTVKASATSARTITAWHIYVDSVDKFDGGQVNSITASLTDLTAGTHTMIVRAWDASGLFGDETMQITVETGVTVSVSTPADGATVNSPTTIAASATSGHTITGWHIYVDGTDQFSAGQVSSINASVPMSAGTHTVIVRAWDSTGAFGDRTLTLNVVNGVTVTVSTPANGATVTSPVAIAASATSGHTITGWHIYVDSADVYSAGQVSSISTNVPMNAGTHTVIVRAWDSTGAFGDRTLTITVH
ncbi:MAG TPA: Ig-like domain-containing protein [Thermoanaerobaculia bacterium]|nr:Ig-like domain-containing protein [Thermoanaerobaculia bacterium]